MVMLGYYKHFDVLNFLYYVISENTHTSHMEGIFSKNPPPLWNPQEIPIPSVGRVWIFSGNVHQYIFHYCLHSIPI